MSHHLIVLPDDTAKPILDAVNGAKKSLNIRMFLFTEPTLLDAVIAAKRRAVNVRVMLNPARRSGESENEESRKALTDAGIDVRDSNPAFDLTHQKSMVVDNETGFVESLNWEPKDLTQTRDYAIVTTHGHEVAEMVAGFDADWEHKAFTPRAESALIWCPDNGRPRVARFIDDARHSLWVQNERYQDQVIIERLVRAVTRGVKLHVLAKPPHSLKPEKLVEGVGGLRILQDVGAKIHTLHHLKLHAKMILADGKRAIVGSINLAPGSFDSRRELAIETDKPHVVRRLQETAEHDWGKSRPLDLSDAGLLADLKKRKGLSPEQLVLYEDSEDWNYHKHHHGAHGGAQPKYAGACSRQCSAGARMHARTRAARLSGFPASTPRASRRHRRRREGRSRCGCRSPLRAAHEGTIRNLPAKQTKPCSAAIRSRARSGIIRFDPYPGRVRCSRAATSAIMIRLYFFPGNASLTPHMLLEEIGAPFELELVDRTAAAHKSPEYLKLNPNGQIPVLVDGDLVLYETAAICLHLADTHPDARLAPPFGTAGRAHYYKWFVWCTNTLQAMLMHYFYPDRLVDDGDAAAAAQVKAHAEARIAGMLDQLDAQLAAHGQDWLLGATFSAVDPFVLMLCRWTRGFARPARSLPHLGPYLQRMLARPAVQRAFATEKLPPPLV